MPLKSQNLTLQCIAPLQYKSDADFSLSPLSPAPYDLDAHLSPCGPAQRAPHRKWPKRARGRRIGGGGRTCSLGFLSRGGRPKGPAPWSRRPVEPQQLGHRRGAARRGAVGGVPWCAPSAAPRGSTAPGRLSPGRLPPRRRRCLSRARGPASPGPEAVGWLRPRGASAAPGSVGKVANLLKLHLVALLACLHVLLFRTNFGSRRRCQLAARSSLRRALVISCNRAVSRAIAAKPLVRASARTCTQSHGEEGRSEPELRATWPAAPPYSSPDACAPVRGRMSFLQQGMGRPRSAACTSRIPALYSSEEDNLVRRDKGRGRWPLLLLSTEFALPRVGHFLHDSFWSTKQAHSQRISTSKPFSVHIMNLWRMSYPAKRHGKRHAHLVCRCCFLNFINSHFLHPALWCGRRLRTLRSTWIAYERIITCARFKSDNIRVGRTDCAILARELSRAADPSRE